MRFSVSLLSLVGVIMYGCGPSDDEKAVAAAMNSIGGIHGVAGMKLRPTEKPTLIPATAKQIADLKKAAKSIDELTMKMANLANYPASELVILADWSSVIEYVSTDGKIILGLNRLAGKLEMYTRIHMQKKSNLPLFPLAVFVRLSGIMNVNFHVDVESARETIALALTRIDAMISQHPPSHRKLDDLYVGLLAGAVSTQQKAAVYRFYLNMALLTTLETEWTSAKMVEARIGQLAEVVSAQPVPWNVKPAAESLFADIMNDLDDALAKLSPNLGQQYREMKLPLEITRM